MLRRIVENRAPRLAAIEPESLEAARPEDGVWTLEAAFAYCERIARAHEEFYPVASHFLPEELRKHVWALYAFARSADDFADEPRFEGRRAEALGFWEDQLVRAFHGEAEHPVFVALCDTIERFELPFNPLSDMLTAFTMDLSVKRYTTYAALERYCAYTAHPVGRLMLHIFGHGDPGLYRYSDDICSGLQQAHLWQDVGKNLEKDRIYLPQEDLVHFGVTEEDLFARRVTPGFRDLMRFQLARTRALFERGRPLIERVGGAFRSELSMIWASGVTILENIEAVDYDVFHRRPELSFRAVARVAARGLPEHVLARR